MGKIRKALTILRKGWFRFRRPVVYGFALLCLAALLVYFLPEKRSFVITAETRGVEIEFTGQTASAWRLSNATVCFRRPQRQPSAVSQPDCDASLFERAPLSVAEIAWPVGTRLSLTKRDAVSPLEMQILEPVKDSAGPADAKPPPQADIAGRPLLPRSRIMISDETWRDVGSLIFSGTVKIGSVPSPGSSDHLMNGSYQVMQAPSWADPVVVAEGKFLPGDQIEILDEAKKKPVTINGFISVSQALTAQGVQVTAYSPAGRNYMRIDRLGAETSVISSNWFDRAVKDPVLLAISALLAVLLPTLELHSKIFGEPEKKKKPAMEEGGASDPAA